MTAPSEHNLAVLAERAFERRGDYESLLFEGRWWRSGELFDRAARLAGGLRSLGVSPGERVVVTMANSDWVGVVYNALWRAGAVVTPATFLLPEADLRHLIEDAGACGVITTPEFLEKVTGAVEDVGSVRFVACTDEGEGAVSLSSLSSSGAAPIVPRASNDLAALLYTGGTTGRAKGVMLTHANLAYTGWAAHEVAHVSGINRTLVPLPLSHAYGILVTVTGLYNEEPPVSVLLRWYESEAFLGAIAEHRLQQAAVVPSMLQLLLASRLEDYDLRSLRFMTSGGAPLPPEVEAAVRERLPWVSIRQGYGLTESGALISSNPVGAERAGSVGRPVPGCEVRVVDDSGRELGPSEHGEILARSPGVMVGYWRAAEATAEALRDGWLHTGDIGYRDEDGYLHIVDRKKDLIIRGGFNVYPRDVEDALVEHPAVAMAGVVGRPDEVHGEEVVAFVSLRKDASATPSELVEWARERIGGYRYPREVEIVEAIPLTPVGKIDRKALRGRLVSRV